MNFNTIAQWQQADRWDQVGRYLAEAAKGLERAGANCVMICADTMHLVADGVAGAVEIPFIHIIDETARCLVDAGCRKPLLIATRYTMEQGFYQQRMSRHGIDVLVPSEADRNATHAIIFDELCQGKILDTSRTELMRMINEGKANGADSVIFGCTEIGLILDPAAMPLPAFDSTVIHAEAAIRFALEGRST